MGTIVCDVRPDLRAGREPFSKIMAAVDSLQPGDELELWATFEPVPLYSVLGRMGFQHESRQTESGDWRIRFYRDPAGGS